MKIKFQVFLLNVLIGYSRSLSRQITEVSLCKTFVARDFFFFKFQWKCAQINLVQSLHNNFEFQGKTDWKLGTLSGGSYVTFLSFIIILEKFKFSWNFLKLQAGYIYDNHQAKYFNSLDREKYEKERYFKGAFFGTILEWKYFEWLFGSFLNSTCSHSGVVRMVVCHVPCIFLFVAEWTESA